MHLQEIDIKNIRSLKRFRMDFNPEEYAGWHVLLGDNGSGKSTVIRSIALCLAGPQQAAALRQNWSDWLKPKIANERIIGKRKTGTRGVAEWYAPRCRNRSCS